MCVGSWAAFYYFRAKKESRFAEKRRAALMKTPPFWPIVRLEVEPQTELHPAPIVRVRQVKEFARSKVCVDLIELRVIEEIKGFPTEIESGLLVNRELLEEAEVEVQASRQIQGVAPDIAERKARRSGESRWVVGERPTLAGVLICGESGMGIAHQIGPGAGARAISHAS